MVNRKFPLSFALSVFVMLTAGCSGDVYDGQASLYEEYKERLDTASSYESIKKLNTELNTKMVAFVRGNSEDVEKFYKEAAQHKEGIKELAKAESEYVKAYLNKVMDHVLGQQVALYTEYTEKVNGAQNYDELVKLNHSLTSAVSKLGSENNDELKKATAFKICQEQFAELNKAGEAFKSAFIGKITPYLFDAEVAIYNRYYDKLTVADGYKDLKLVKQFLDKDIMLFHRENSMVQVAPDEYVAEKEEVAKAKARFMDAYLGKVVMPMIEYQKDLYSGTAKLFATVKDATELKELKADFVLVNKQFLTENAEELDYVAAEIAKGNINYRREMETVNSLFKRLE